MILPNKFKNMTFELPNGKCVYFGYKSNVRDYIYCFTVKKDFLTDEDKQIMLNRIPNYPEKTDYDLMTDQEKRKDIYGLPVELDNFVMCLEYMKYIVKSERIRYRFKSFTDEQLNKFNILVEWGFEKPYVSRSSRV